MTEADEQRLIEEAQKDPRKFAELYERNFGRVYAFVSRRVRDRHEAEDLTAEVFQQALANLSRFEWRSVPFAAWLLRIAANAMADRWNRGKKERKDDAIPDNLANTDWKQVERRAILVDLVDALPDDQRHVIIQRFVEQKSIREIAQEIGRTEGAVKQLQFRAIESLRARIGGGHE